MHGGLVVFDLDDIVSAEFFDHDVGRFILVMHGVEGEGGSVHDRHLAQESLGGGDLVGFVGGSDLGDRLRALMIDRGHQVQGLCRFFVGAFESLTVNGYIAGQPALGRGHELGENLIEKLGLDVLQDPVEDIIAGGLKTACFRVFQERKARNWA